MTNLLSTSNNPLIRPFAEFFRTESASGLILLGSSVTALLLANIDVGIGRYFPAIWDSTLSLSVNDFRLEKTVAHWINDGLMALFFLVVGLEIKREVLEGELSSIQQAALPLVSAVGGMVVPALLFLLTNWQTPTHSGWGIPMATDIAFALAILYLLGDRVPLSLKIFLTALAIADDLGAVMVIALFYTHDIHLDYLAWAGGIWVLLLILNHLGVRILTIYLLFGLVLWYVTLKSGVHATIAGVLLAITIPFRIRYTQQELMRFLHHRMTVIREAIQVNDVQPRDITEELEDINEHISSPAQRLEAQLHGPVSFVIIPLFAFCNTSLLIDVGLINQLLSPLPLGIMIGLFIGKPLGISLLAWLAVRLGFASLPAGVRWLQLIGVACLAGIGFTMSIFVTLLAFAEQPASQGIAKLAILIASLLSGVLGYVLLAKTLPQKNSRDRLTEALEEQT
ncbi:Na(+)/H(+) antiporter nhaA AltName: Full=Sodium/proton antiporter nhaA [Fibrisoma limi BUZ 3]|uniref:Na(+)/H(+) antiporter NhaA n=1 Tax=Fibrisoma limi BUZ 3 TaxID=1185876 RepID=I2GKG5_9BACT|nr:Na+/H+ antiporter NhaA [Fibrisoma limi]CCH54390.1 Na(+)/H(+) antiporter nhaA AltName: Full=Sodium/proton antiporter nhaA [Fibrisoma limi BUZ 3]